MKIAVLWTKPSGYFNACYKQLYENKKVELYVANMAPTWDAPFQEDIFSWLKLRYQWQNRPQFKRLQNDLNIFNPDVIIVSSWHTQEYRKILRKFNNKLRVLAMDNPWLGTTKQWIGVLTSRWYLHSLYDAVFLPGERQAIFAQKLGFKEFQIICGLYCCDYEQFASVYPLVSETMPEAFIYVGRFSSEKGIVKLREGYLQYCRKVKQPWPLICCGSGPLESLLRETPGIILMGFVQPQRLHYEFTKASCLILPSYFEPWGLVIHEATSAGLAVICSNQCGASVHLVQDGYNGYIIQSNDAKELSQAMMRYSSSSREKRLAMSMGSHLLSQQFTPQRWAEQIYERCQILMQYYNK